MTFEALLDTLCNGTNKHFRVLPTPSEAAELIVNELLFDLSNDRKECVRHAIIEWGQNYSSFVSAVEAESSSEY